MPYCTKCGSLAREDDLFCAKCGKPIEKPLESDNSASFNSDLINPNLPIVLDYDDKYDNSSADEVIRAYDDGDLAATYELAYRYSVGEQGVAIDEIKAVNIFKELLTKQNNSRALRQLGILIAIDSIYGDGRRTEGVPYLEAALELGDAIAAGNLGLIYMDGNVFPKDLDKALKYFKKAIALGEDTGWLYIGKVYHDQGKIKEAKEALEKALEFEKIKYAAALELGHIFEHGTKDLEVNLDKALSYYELAYKNRDKDEEAGNDATYFLAKFLFNDKSGKEEDERAFKLFVEDSERGFKRSNLFIGFYFGFGIENCLEPNVNRAFEYLDNVLESDKADALFYKGSIYLDVLNDQSKAKEYLLEAVNAGSEEAKDLLDELNSKRPLVCSRCGNSVSDDAMFCGKCGAPVDTTNSNQPSTSDPNSPQNMVNQAGKLLDSGKLRDACDLLAEAYRMYPNDNKVIDCYTIVLSIELSAIWGIGADGSESTKRYCNTIFELTDKLRKNNYKLDHAEEFESDAHYGMGRYYKANGDKEMALKELKQADIMLNPFASYLIYDIHIDLAQTHDRRTIEKEFVADVELLKKALNSNHFANDRDKCLVYLALYSQYCMGSSYVPQNVNYAYECAKKAYELCPEIAEEELTHFKTDYRGNLVYYPD